jgi:phosphatidylglycerol:prolipoprotein diacylglycerol transferase
MLRVLFEVPGLGWRLHSFGPMLLIACGAALWLATRRARREGLDPESISDLAIWLFAGGFIGARILFIVQNPGAVTSWIDALKVWQGGIIFYGCILGGLTGSLIYWARRRFPFLATADAVAPALAVGAAIGRIGCFLNGCCYGETCNLPWAVTFPSESYAWIRHVEAGWIAPWATRSLPVHPKQLYLALGGLALFALLTVYYPRRRRDGEVMALLMIAYPITRFATEFFRGDAEGWYGGLTISQYISLALIAGGLLAWRILPARRLVDTVSAPLSNAPAGGEPARAAA